MSNTIYFSLNCKVRALFFFSKTAFSSSFSLLSTSALQLQQLILKVSVQLVKPQSPPAISYEGARGNSE